MGWKKLTEGHGTASHGWPAGEQHRWRVAQWAVVPVCMGVDSAETNTSNVASHHAETAKRLPAAAGSACRQGYTVQALGVLPLLPPTASLTQSA